MKKPVQIALVTFLISLVAHASELPMIWAPWEIDTQMAPLIVQGISAKVTKEFNRTHKAVRDAHAKQHGCVLAELTVDKDVVAHKLAVGIFKEPGKVYEAAIRYSNGDGDPEVDDRLAMPRGMAIKVMNVPGDKMVGDEILSQDFPMINFPVFFVKNALDYGEFAKDEDHSTFVHNPRHSEEAKILGAMVDKVTNPPTNVLESTFFSMTPRQFGEPSSVKPIKYSATPVPCAEQVAAPAVALKDDPNSLRLALKETLVARDVCFDFRIQRSINQSLTPVDDPTVEWKTNWETVGQIRIASTDSRGRYSNQPDDLEARETKCENIAINPWHSLPEHQPLGSVEYVRKLVYGTIAALRHKLNGVQLWEPKGFADWQ